MDVHGLFFLATDTHGRTRTFFISHRITRTYTKWVWFGASRYALRPHKQGSKVQGIANCSIGWIGLIG